MTNILACLRGYFRPNVSEDKNASYDRAMKLSGDLIDKLGEVAKARHPVLEIFVDLWTERNNVPYSTTMYEANQEMIAPLRQTLNGKLQ